MPARGFNLIALATNGNAAAVRFLECWGDYIRGLDNAIDDGQWSADNILNVLALGCRFYSDTFYRQHVSQLQPAILIITDIYAISVKWEREPEPWKRQWADVLRHVDGQLVSHVALICGGWDNLQKITAAFLPAAYIDHKDRHGLPNDPKP